jgi:hypothetical protein
LLKYVADGDAERRTQREQSGDSLFGHERFSPSMSKAVASNHLWLPFSSRTIQAQPLWSHGLPDIDVRQVTESAIN